MIVERCPHCRAVLPAAKTCPVCSEVFYRGEGGRTDAEYCSADHASVARMRRFRDRQREEQR